MNPIFHCELEYISSQHLNQLYDGFLKLEKKKIITLSIKKSTGDPTKPLLKVILKINNSKKQWILYYDTLDGLNWIHGSTEENLLYFQNNFNCDYYFKRSFNKDIVKYAPKMCKVFPLGLNYNIEPKYSINPISIVTVKKHLKELIRESSHKSLFYSSDFEFPPIPNKKTKIFFLTRLWDPDKVSLSSSKKERKEMNQFRINCIKRCRKEFGELFTGGLQKNEFTVQNAKELIAPSNLTNRINFIKTTKEHNICITTTGLHSSTGWKFGEYMAASRAIISEPLLYDAPGDFSCDKNYYEFNSEDELIEKIYKLLNNRDKMNEMMHNNFNYYNNYLKSENLILNTLMTVYYEQNK